VLSEGPIGPVDAESDDALFFVKDQLEYALIVPIVRDKRVPKITEGLPATLQTVLCGTRMYS
jgi:hypothetical protein